MCLRFGSLRVRLRMRPRSREGESGGAWQIDRSSASVRGTPEGRSIYVSKRLVVR
jgi:hypothetical protein